MDSERKTGGRLNPEPQDCQHWQPKIIDRLADELGEDDSVLLEQHLAECPTCTQEERRLRVLFDAAAVREEWVPDPAIETRLLAMLRARDRRERRPSILRWPLPSYAALSFAAIALVAGLWLGHSIVPGRQVPQGEPSSTTPSDFTPAGESPGGAPVREDSWLASTAAGDGYQTAEGFTITPSDAIGLGQVEPDSL